MRLLVLLVALLILTLGMMGIFFPEILLKIGQSVTTPRGLYLAAVLRIAIGVILVLGAATSRAPKTLRLLGVLAIVAGMTTPILGVDRAKAILDWWSAQGPVVIRLHPGFAVIMGAFLLYAGRKAARS
jgi:hypothetical protein